MTQMQRNPSRIGVSVVIALVLLIVVLFVFVIAVVNVPPEVAPEGTISVDSTQTYAQRVDALLAIAHPENAEAALTKYACISCHRAEANAIGPLWTGLAERAAAERPPLTAAAYIYESIVDPGVFLVDGYNDVMPHDFGARMSEQELADVLAYLLTPDAR